MNVSLRPLRIEDAAISYLWRNNPEIWKYTGNKPDKEITLQTETEWLSRVLLSKDEKRFAICVGENEEYVGNVQLTDIDQSSAQFHIFIGNPKFHNKGIGTEATSQIIKYAFNTLKIKKVWLKVNSNNFAAINSYKKCGFVEMSNDNGTILMMILNDGK